MEKGYVKVKFLRAAPKYAYSAGDIGIVSADKAPGLLSGGYIIILPEEDDQKENLLPEDLPGRDKLFAAGFDSVEKVKAAGDSLLDAVSNTMLKKIKAYLK